MKNFKLLFCIAISLFSVFVVFASDTELPYSSIEKKGIVFSWRINGDFLDIIISAPCKGWISVGIDPTVKMKDADIIIGYIKKGKVFIVDNYGTGPVFHKPDTSLGGEDNIQNKAGKEGSKRSIERTAQRLQTDNQNSKRPSRYHAGRGRLSEKAF